ncbi:MAG: four-carbon acid sugar kinase family protein [Bacteroidales bacterium]|nr:four-carbon acid sugar kinase family protein [Bacteroidales bacterium]MBN2761892.1 four-carbon acid sugar kinase family protein [Bacteroidales bacterium]
MSQKKKIIVIADDFTGAAEIGGIGLRHGLNVVIETEVIDNKNADLLIIATDTRSMNKLDAMQYIARITKELICFQPLFIYKKIDSVLRGNIAEELVAQMETMHKKRSIIIAANPVFNRIIKDGIYYIDDIPLDQTCFSNDSQYPVKNAGVLNVLSTIRNTPVVNLKPDDKLPGKGLIIGDVENVEDLNKWAVKFDERTLFAGASGFFDSLLMALHLKNGTVKSQPAPFGKNALFVLGSLYPKDELLLSKMVQYGHVLSNMPDEIYNEQHFSENSLEKWINEVITAIDKHHKVIVSSVQSTSTEAGISIRIRQVMAKLVKKVADLVKLNEILIEGGSTTSAILKHLSIKKLIPVQELDTGVIRMKAEDIPDLYITTKPGSYLWPENVWLPGEIEKLTHTKFTG